MSEMVERVAVALGEAEIGNAAIQDWHWQENMPRLLKLARAAIEAMREPTAAVLDQLGHCEDGTLSAWQDAIDAALSETVSQHSSSIRAKSVD